MLWWIAAAFNVVAAVARGSVMLAKAVISHSGTTTATTTTVLWPPGLCLGLPG